ncbi:hypothetical protein OG225_10475 [Nocardia sp. NBC_01377]|uniref:hypothetical protein n=1 Tax=Nocardia sp. NBC_01377 TaxID=2903595 RepID=UPI00324E1920
MAYQQYPGAYGPNPGGNSAPAPSGATAIIAGVSACLGVLGNLGGAVVLLVIGVARGGVEFAGIDLLDLLRYRGYYTFPSVVAVAVGVGHIITAIVLAVGAIMLFNRKASGRALAVAGCAGTILWRIVGVIGIVRIIGPEEVGPVLGGEGALVSVIFPIATMILALVPATSKWLAYRPSSARPGYPPPGRPQPGFAPPYNPHFGTPQFGTPQPGYPQQPYSGQAAPVYGPPSGVPQPAPAYPSAPDPLAESPESWRQQGGW